VEVRAQTTDSIELRIAIDTPAILLVTNNYSPGWRAHSLIHHTPTQLHNPTANWTQQAIALSTGKHHVLLDYRRRASHRALDFDRLIAGAGDHEHLDRSDCSNA